MRLIDLIFIMVMVVAIYFVRLGYVDSVARTKNYEQREQLIACQEGYQHYCKQLFKGSK